MEDALPLRVDQFGHPLDQAGEKLRIIEGPFPVRPAAVAVDEEQFQVRSVPEGGASQLSQTQNGVLGFEARDGSRPAEPLNQILVDDSCCRTHHGFSKVGEGSGKGLEIHIGIQDVIQIDQKNLPVFEIVQPLPPFFQRSRSLEHAIQSPLKRFTRRGMTPAFLVRAQKGKQALVLETDEVFPEKVAGSEQPGQILEQLRVPKPVLPIFRPVLSGQVGQKLLEP